MEKEKYWPIVIFCFNRLDTLKVLINGLLKNYETPFSPFIFFVDGPRNTIEERKVSLVTDYVKALNIGNSKEIIIREKNLGLAQNIFDGLNIVFKKFEAAIILEDDLLISKYYLEYMNFALNKYASNQSVYSINGANYHIPIIPKKNSSIMIKKALGCSMGWATWSRVWGKYELNPINDIEDLESNFPLRLKYNYFGVMDRARGMISLKDGIRTWDFQFAWLIFKHNACVVIPDRRMLKHIGWDSGTNAYPGMENVNQIFDENYRIKNFPETNSNYYKIIVLVFLFFIRSKSSFFYRKSLFLIYLKKTFTNK